MLEKVFKQFWLSDKEAKIYFTLLKLGEAQPSSIARICWENRGNTYMILQKLEKKWFTNKTFKNKKIFYIAISPEIILEKEKNKLRK